MCVCFSVCMCAHVQFPEQCYGSLIYKMVSDQRCEEVRQMQILSRVGKAFLNGILLFFY